MILYPQSASLPPVETQRSDREIQLAMHLERRLECLMQLTVRAHICENQLQLFGRVGSWYEKQQAQEIARAVAPEYLIRNEVRVIVA